MARLDPLPGVGGVVAQVVEGVHRLAQQGGDVSPGVFVSVDGGGVGLAVQALDQLGLLGAGHLHVDLHLDLFVLWGGQHEAFGAAFGFHHDGLVLFVVGKSVHPAADGVGVLLGGGEGEGVGGGVAVGDGGGRLVQDGIFRLYAALGEGLGAQLPEGVLLLLGGEARVLLQVAPELSLPLV